MNKKNAKFSCLAFKKKTQVQIQNKMKDLSPKQQLTFIRSQVASGPFGRWWKQTHQKAA